MKLHFSKSSTLIELIASLAILSILVIVFGIIDLFSHRNTLSADRRARVQNSASYVLEHHVKEISRAIGNEIIDAASGGVINRGTISGDTAIRAYVDLDASDLDASGQPPGDGQRGIGGDRWIAYRFRPASAPVLERYQIWLCPDCTDASCVTCNSGWNTNVLSRHITAVDYNYTSGNNYVDVELTACWDPNHTTTPDGCGSSDNNPSVSLRTRIKMPAVSTN